MKKIQLGIIGCGIAAKKLHWPALSKLSDTFDVVGVCNHTEPKAVEFARIAGGVPWVLDYRELLAMNTVEAVDIVLPIHLNFRVTRDALEAGKHVIVEKPLAANLREAKAMLAFPKRYHSVMMVAENCRYQPLYLRAKQAMENGSIGRVYAATWNVLGNVTTTNEYARTQWRVHHRYPGGFLTDAGVHNMAVLRMLFGEIASVTGFTRRMNPSIGKLDTLGMMFDSNKGVSGSMNLFFSAPGMNERRLLIFGTEGTMDVADSGISVKRHNQPDERITVDSDGGFVGEFQEFYNAIRGNTNVQGSFREAARDLQVIISALDAARAGKKKLIHPLR